LGLELALGPELERSWGRGWGGRGCAGGDSDGGGEDGAKDEGSVRRGLRSWMTNWTLGSARRRRWRRPRRWRRRRSR